MTEESNSSKIAKVVLYQLEQAHNNGLEVEWMETFLEHVKNGYSVIESCYHANYEWDL